MFRQSIALKPEGNYIAHSNLGTLFFGQARFADAAHSFEMALADDDSSYKVWGNLGFASHYGGNPGQATEPLRKAIELAEGDLDARGDDIHLITDIASYHAILGDVQETLTYLGQATALGATNPFDMLSIGESYQHVGHRDEAVHWIRSALEAGLPEGQLDTRPELRDLMDEARLDRSENAPPGGQ